MASRFLAISALIVFHFIAALASPIGERTDDELIKVPGGFVSKSNFHVIPEGGKIIHTTDLVQLLDATGNILHSSSLTGSGTVPTTGSSSLEARQDGTNTSSVIASFEAPSVSNFTGTWVVPPLPRVDSGQLLQYFIGLTPPSQGALLFPVLQYGVAANGGGAFWSLSTWLITGNQAFATNITHASKINPFDTPRAFITKQPGAAVPLPGVNAWEAGFLPNIAAVQMQGAIGFNEIVVALEATGAHLESNFPPGTATLFDVSLEETASSPSSPSSIPWQITDDPTGKINMEVASDSGASGALLISHTANRSGFSQS